MAAKKPLTNGATGVEQIADTDTAVMVGGASVGTASAPAASAVLDVVSTTKGVLLTPMTTTQRDAITSPAANLLITNNETDGLDMHNGTRWQRLTQSSGTPSFSLSGGLGTGATSSIEGTDLAGMITINTGSGSLSFTSIGTLTFNTAFPTGAKYTVFFQAENANATSANMSAYLRVSTRAVGSFVIDGSNGNIQSRVSPSTTYTVFYNVVQYE